MRDYFTSNKETEVITADPGTEAFFGMVKEIRTSLSLPVSCVYSKFRVPEVLI